MTLVESVVKRILPLVLEREWAIAIYQGRSPLALEPSPAGEPPVLTRLDVTDFLASFVADPFMIQVGGTWHMFFEAMRTSVFDGSVRKGQIALATSRDGRRWEYQRSVLSEPFHLSYPYVLEWNSEYYMIPESHEAKAVRLYRADPFPFRWVLDTVLLEGPVLLDPSVFRHDGRWWMFVETSPKYQNDTLRLFHAADLRGPWTEHPSSPIMQGVRNGARPAGRVLSTPSQLLRFGQDCSSAYGTSVKAFEITRLTVEDYQEVECGGPPVVTGSGRGWNRGGMHHLDAHPLEGGQWMACTDGWATVRRPKRIIDWAKGLRR